MSNEVLLEAKRDYTKSLCSFMSPQIYRGIKSIYLDAEKLSFRNQRDVLMKFQKLLENIPKWDTATLSIEYDRICRDSNCSYLEDLITAVFVCHTKVLTAVQDGRSKSNIELNIPAGVDFLHKCYIEVARKFWQTPGLFSSKVPLEEYQKNIDICTRVINTAIQDTVQHLLPIESIIKQYLENVDTSSDNISITSEMFHQNLQKTLIKDIDSYSIHSESPMQKFIHSDDNDMFIHNKAELGEDKDVSYEEQEQEQQEQEQEQQQEQQEQHTQQHQQHQQHQQPVPDEQEHAPQEQPEQERVSQEHQLEPEPEPTPSCSGMFDVPGSLTEPQLPEREDTTTDTCDESKKITFHTTQKSKQLTFFKDSTDSIEEKEKVEDDDGIIFFPDAEIL